MEATEDLREEDHLTEVEARVEVGTEEEAEVEVTEEVTLPEVEEEVTVVAMTEAVADMAETQVAEADMAEAQVVDDLAVAEDMVEGLLRTTTALLAVVDPSSRQTERGVDGFSSSEDLCE